MTHEDAIAAILAREQEKGVVTEAELRQQLADVTNERDELRVRNDQLRDSLTELNGIERNRDALQLILNDRDQKLDDLQAVLMASEAQSAEAVFLLREAYGAVKGHAMTAWAIPMAAQINAFLLAQSAPATDEQGAGA